MRHLALLLGVLGSQALPAQSYSQTAYGDANPAHPSFAASPDAYYFAHGTDHELIRTDLDGQVIWSRRLEFGNTPVSMYRITYIDGSLLVSGGHAAQQNFFAKLDTAGNILWANAANYGDINIATRIHSAGDGYLTVGHREFPTGGGWTFDITLSRWDANGDLLWGKAIGDDFHDFFGWTSLVLANGDILVAGEREDPVVSGSLPLIARFDANGDLLWMKVLAEESGFFTHLEPADMIATSNGNFAVVATTYNTFSNYDAHVMKLDGEGNVLWAWRMFQVGWTESGHSIMEDSQQRLLVGGGHSMGNASGVHVARFDLAGSYLDAKTIPHFDTPTPGGYYAGVGQDLVERNGGGYAYAGECAVDLNSPAWHGITTFDFDPGAACGDPAEPYPFTFTAYTWADSLITDPTTATNITETAVALTSSPIPITGFDFCDLVLSVETPGAGTSRPSIAPNPTEGPVTCTWSMHKAGPVIMAISDMTGRFSQVLVSGTFAAGKQYRQFDLSALAPGVYMLRSTINGTEMSARIVKR